MNTVCLLGSPRRDGNSDVLAHRFCDAAQNLGASVQRADLSALSYQGCVNLFRCKQDLSHCGQVDDLTPILKAIADAQVLVLASPIYFTNVSGQLKLVIDRMFSFLVPDYVTNSQTSRLGSGRTVVFVQTQGEPENRYGDLLNAYSAGFHHLGFDHQHLIRAWGVREPGEVADRPDFMARCDQIAAEIYG